MKFNQLFCILGASLVLNMAQAAETKVDGVAAIVNNGVVLQSEVNEMVDRVKQAAEKQGQTLPSDKVLRVQALERLIGNSLQLQMAKRMGLQITDQQLDQAIENISKEQNMTVEQFRQQAIAEEGNYEQFRERLRDEITVGEVMRANVQRRIYVSPQEVDSLMKIMDEQGVSNEQYNLGHILISVENDPNAEQIKDAEERAKKVVDLLKSGNDFRKIAVASSSASNALEGGEMGYMNINEMPTLFADAVRGKKKGDMIGPLRSGAGFHILTIFDIKGANVVEFEEVHARHVLIKPSIILSDEKAQKMLAEFTAQLAAGKADFATFAKEHSEDPGSRLKGGDLGWMDPTAFVPEFRDTLKRLNKGEISKPFASQFGWHVVQLLDRRTVDATAEKKREQVTRMLYNRRYNEESANFVRELRDEAYVEVMESE